MKFDGFMQLDCGS